MTFVEPDIAGIADAGYATGADLTGEESLADRVTRLRDDVGTLAGRGLIGELWQGEFHQRMALVSSFGAESAVLLHMVSEVDRSIPVIFLDTGKLFPETLAYRDQLVDLLGLTDVRSVDPDPRDLKRHDPDGTLWSRDPDRCCWIRKTEPLDAALTGFDAWITGRKRFHSDSRAELGSIEGDPQSGRIKINPLVTFSLAEIRAYMTDRALPAHPLVARGYPSIGCAVCTKPVKPGEDVRAGRWAGRDKTECGIHGGGI